MPITADRTRVVRDPYTGVNRQIIAGQVVPPDLEDAVEGPSVVDHDQQVNRDAPAPKAKKSTKDDEKTDDGDDLEGLKRDELNKLAEEEGVEKPGDLKNADEVIAAIREARA